jgi:tRNA A37 threonylcarbamoyladenosine synthetase subunit TsaC/SUA5/YrdC
MPWHLHLAVRHLRRGGLVLHATEGVWGLACDPGTLTP